MSVASSILDVPSQDWDACNMDATGPEKFNPFLTHGFLSSLEETGCAVKVATSYLDIISSQICYQSLIQGPFWLNKWKC